MRGWEPQRYEARLLSLFFVDPDGMQLEVACFFTGDVFEDGDYQVHQA
jgi:hypothetical protein